MEVSSFLFTEYSCLDLTEAHAVTRGSETVKGLRQELVEKPSTLRMMDSLLNSAGKGCFCSLSLFMLLPICIFKFT